MTIDEAITQLESFCKAFENEDIKKYTMQKYGNIDSVTKDYKATKILLDEIQNKIKHIIELESKIFTLKYKLNKYKNYDLEKKLIK